MSGLQFSNENDRVTFILSSDVTGFFVEPTLFQKKFQRKLRTQKSIQFVWKCCYVNKHAHFFHIFLYLSFIKIGLRDHHHHQQMVSDLIIDKLIYIYIWNEQTK